MAASEAPCRRVILVRHGHYERTEGGSDLTWGLSALGRRQAVRSGRRLAQILAAASGGSEGLYASPWPRAAQTAEISAHQCAVSGFSIKPYLHEVVALVDPDRLDFGALPLVMARTTAQDHATAHAQVERVRRRFFRRPRRRSIVVLFTHGNLIRFLVARTLGLPYEAWAMMDIAHAGLTELRVYGNGFEALVSFNETGHLSPSMVTTA